MFRELPTDILFYLAHHLDARSVGALSCSAKFFMTALSNPIIWTQKIANTFGLSEPQINALSIQGDASCQASILHLAYRRLMAVKNNETSSLRFAGNCFLHDPKNWWPLFIASLDQVDLLLSETNPRYQDALYTFSLYMKCTHVPKFLYDELCKADIDEEIARKKSQCLIIATRAGHLDHVQIIFQTEKYLSKIKHKERAYQELLGVAAMSGNIALIDYFLNKLKAIKDIISDTSSNSNNDSDSDSDSDDGLEFGVKNPINAAAEQGHLHAIKHLLQKGYAIDAHTIHHAARSGSLTLVQFLVDEHHKTPNLPTLIEAAQHRCQEVYDYLTIDPTKFNLSGDLLSHTDWAGSDNKTLQYNRLVPMLHTIDFEEVISIISRSNNVQLLQYVLDNIVNPHLFEPNELLRRAMRDGSFEIVRYVLDPKHGFNIKLESVHFKCAFLSKHEPQFKFLLAPSKRFAVSGFKPITDSLKDKKSLCELSTSHHLFLFMLEKIIKYQDERDNDLIKKDCLESIDSCVEQFTGLLQDALLSPSVYSLEPKAAKLLFYKAYEILHEVSTSQKPEYAHHTSFVVKTLRNCMSWLQEHEQQITGTIVLANDKFAQMVAFKPQ